MKNNFSITSHLPELFKEQLEYLLFFNPAQEKVVSGILSSIEKYGLPEINIVDNQIKITVGELLDVQTIYALDNDSAESILAAVMLYYRENTEDLVILHMAVSDEYSLNSTEYNSMILLEMFNSLKKNAAKLKGIEKIIIYYQKDKKSVIPIKKI